MVNIRTINPVSSATAIIGAVAALVAGVTFAQLTSTATLTDNTISSASADLQVSTNNVDFGPSKPGFDFINLVPGGSAQPDPGKLFQLKDNGTADLTLKVSISSSPSNPNSVDFTKTFLRIARSGGATQDFSLQSLITANGTGGVSMTDSLLAGATEDYRAQA